MSGTQVLLGKDKLVTKFGVNPDKTCCALDDKASKSNVMVQKSPCITASRGAAGGHWLTNRGRSMKLTEVIRLQGMSPLKFKGGPKMTDFQVGKAVGNAMTQTVLADIFKNLLPLIGFRTTMKANAHDSYSKLEG